MRRLLLLPMLLLPACNWERPAEKKPINCYLADARDLASVRRIMVLPFTEESGVDSDQEMVRRSFVTELQKLRRFEVVPLPAGADEDDVLNQTLREGRVSTAAMVKLCERYHLDGVLTGIVSAWRPYMSPYLGVRTQLMSVHSGTVIWAVDALYDTNDRSTLSDLRHYHETFEAKDCSLSDRMVELISPTKFAAYVAHRLAGTWTDE